jgi:hypothetical protein
MVLAFGALTMTGNQRITAVLMIIVSFPFFSANAGEKTYQIGKLVSIESPETPVSLPVPTLIRPQNSPPMQFPPGQAISVPVHLFYKFEIQQADVLYVGLCQRKDYRAEWRVADDIQFRLKKDKIYLRRQKKGELALSLLLTAKLGPDGKPTTIVAFGKYK